jgi:hypothetical protein
LVVSPRCSPCPAGGSRIWGSPWSQGSQGLRCLA